MKLHSFSIQNFRSIIHSGWCVIASDNITALIGQNESGKTSVLESLYSFYTGTIHEDVLRSDLSLPEVSCKFLLEKESLATYFNNHRLPTELQFYFKDCHEIVLTRKWNEERKSTLYISNDEILKFYTHREEIKSAEEAETQVKIEELLRLAENVFREMEIAEKEKNDVQAELIQAGKKLEICKKTFQKAKAPDLQLIAEKELEYAQTDYNRVEIKFKDGVEIFEKAKQTTQNLSEKITVCKSSNESSVKVQQTELELKSIQSYLKEIEHKLESTLTERDIKSIKLKMQQAHTDLQLVQKKLQTARLNAYIQKQIAAKVLNGVKYRQAEVEVKEEFNKGDDYYSLFEMGEMVQKHLPVFEFFEDFSSLLPNKIDLEDILDEKNHVEGYKAARNFLLIAGLNAEFFKEKNHRILKQKIENLNGEITINFQDYWSQNVGKNSKIRLNFELEHYDFTHPEKSGQPYLEFWIKDKQERLYPKQRSRGVRWFLSFYLELKATAKNFDVPRVLLIDEPGLSLHARAQEDVLKVFEDLRDKMQILYCTHSPHLIDVNRLYRILAVQRADVEDDRSETQIIDSASLYSANTDTLSPVYSLMGVQVNTQNIIHTKNNIVVEDTLVYYYLNAFSKIFGLSPIPFFVPSTGLANVPIMCNLLLGWKLEFMALLLGESRSDSVMNELNETIFYSSANTVKQHILKISKYEYPEDIFSTLDFKKFVLQKRIGITESNSNYIIENGISRNVLASQFINYCEEHVVVANDFDEETKSNISEIFKLLQPLLS